MEPGEIGIAFPAEKADFAQYLRFIAFLGKTAIIILHIMGGKNHPVGNLKKIPVIAAIGTGNPVSTFFGFSSFGYCRFMN
jgi:hypothetical protein